MEESMKNWLFSVDLVNYIIEKCEGNFMNLEVSDRKIYGKTPFRDIFGDAIYTSIDCEIESFFEYMYDKAGDGYDPNFAIDRARGLVIDCFKNGYNPKDFIHFCRMQCSIAYVSSENDDVEAGKAVICALTSALEAFTLTGEFKENGGWNVLYECAEKVLSDFNQQTEQWNEYLKSLPRFKMLGMI